MAMDIKKIIRSNINHKYISIYKFMYLLFANRAYSLPQKVIIESEIVQKNIDSVFNNVMFTTSRGLYYIDNNKIIKILSGKVYGITKYDDWYFISRSNNYTNSKNRRQSDIIAIKMKNYQVIEINTLLWGIPGEIHQISIVNDMLHMPHTGYNQVLVADISGSAIKKNTLKKSFLNTLKYGVKISDPSHLNSIYHCQILDKIYLVAHNSTAHTNRNSDIIECDLNYNVSNVINTTAHSAHNIILYNDKIMFSDSNNGKLYHGDRVVFESKKFLRGLSVTDSHIYLGASDISFDEKRRDNSDCSILCIDINSKKVKELSLNNYGNIKDIYHNLN